MAAVSSARPIGQVTLWLRYALIAVALLFAAGGAVQVFLAGLSVFDGPEYWQDHTDFGRMIGFLAYLLPILALLGRTGVRVVGHGLVVALLFVLQTVLANVDTGWIAAFHPLNGFMLMGSSFGLGMRVLGMVRSPNSGTPSHA